MVTSARDTYCSFCGARHVTNGYPRTCPSCKATIWANPIPVSVVLVPVAHQGQTGLLVVRRAIEPAKGKLALTGGFLEEHETWQQGGAREIFEETGLEVDAASLEPFWFTSTAPRPNRVLLFSTAATLDASSFSAFKETSETLARGLIFGPAGVEDVFAFPLHVDAVRRYFGARGVTSAHAYVEV